MLLQGIPLTNHTLQQDSADRNYAASIYSSNRSYAANVYAATLNANTQRKIAGIQSATQRYTADTHRSASLDVARWSNQTQRYGIKQNTQVQRESIRNQWRMNMASNQTHIITAGIGAASNMTGSFARMIPLIK